MANFLKNVFNDKVQDARAGDEEEKISMRRQGPYGPEAHYNLESSADNGAEEKYDR